MTPVCLQMELNEVATGQPQQESKPGKILRCPQEGCGKEFRSSPGYRYHLKSHALDPRPHVCQYCHKKFKSANGLKYHLRKTHNFEPVLGKQNLNSNSPKSQETQNCEEEYMNPPSFQPNYQTNNFTDRGPNVASPLMKNSLALPSPLLKNMPGIPSPLLKSPIDLPQYLSTTPTNSVLPSPFSKTENFSSCLEKVDVDTSQRASYSGKSSGDYSSSSCSRSSLSEYTDLCQKANHQFMEQCHRLSSSEFPPTARLNATQRINQYRQSSDMMKPDNSIHRSSFSSDYNRHSIDSNEQHAPSYVNENTHGFNVPFSRNISRTFSVPMSGKQYRTSDMQEQSSRQCLLATVDSSSCLLKKNDNEYSPDLSAAESPSFRIPSNTQNSEQIVPDISVPNTSPNMANTCDKNNNNNICQPSDNMQVFSDNSSETEYSDCVFRSESCSSSMKRPVVTSISLPGSTSQSCSMAAVSSSPSKPLLIRRTSRSKSIPPLTINACGVSDSKDLKSSASNKLLHLAEIATSPGGSAQNSPVPLTPSIIPDSTPDWVLKSPFQKFQFPDKPYLLTPTISRLNGTDQLSTESPIPTSTSLPPSPFLDNVQTPSFWPSQVWPTPVWLCFLKGCYVKFEHDDKEFMTSEDVAAFCTTPGGRRRDNMNYFTSGMKIVEVSEEKPSLTLGRDIISLTFEQIIPGTQRLVAKCTIDHPFYIKHKGWSAANPTEAMARYGQQFRKLVVGDIAIPSPTSKVSAITAVSPHKVSSSGPQIFTFSSQDTSRFSASKKQDILPYDRPPNKFQLPFEQTSNNMSNTITLTYSNQSPNSRTGASSYESQSVLNSTQRLHNDLRSISEAMKGGKNKQKKQFDTNLNDKKLVKMESSSNFDEQMIDDSFNTKEKIKVEQPYELLTLSCMHNKTMNNETLSTSSLSPINQMNDSNDAPKPKKQKKKRRKPITGDEDQRRPMNGFMLFAKKMRIKLTQTHPGKDNRAISKLLGEEWRALNEDQREEFSRNAKEMADERMKVNPDCWKRKTKKDKDGNPVPSAAVNSSTKLPPDNPEKEIKKQKLDTTLITESINLPNSYVESHNTYSERDSLSMHSSIDVT